MPPVDVDRESVRTRPRRRSTRDCREGTAARALVAALGFFGGVYNYNRMSGFFRKAMEPMKPMWEKAGIPQTDSGVYDAPDMDAIRAWAAELAGA